MLRVFWVQSRALTAANLKSRYRNTFAGFLWVVLNPLIVYGTQSYVFHTILKLQVDRYRLFLLSGLLPWIFITQSLEMCTSLYTSSARLLKSFPVHPLVYLAAQLFDNFVNFIAAFLLILLAVFIWDPVEPLRILLLPLPLVLLFGAVFGMAWMLATVQVFLRDTRFIITFALNLLFFLTPIFYPASFVPEEYRWIIRLNPVNHLIQPFRALIYDELQLSSIVQSMLMSGMIATLSLSAAALFWSRKKNDVYHLL